MDSYQGEGFIYWNQPKILLVLFDVESGLFLYTPLMLFIVAGLAISLIRQNLHCNSILLIFILATYIFSSWWDWDFGCSFSHRCYAEYLSFFSFPLLYVISLINSIEKRIIKASIFFIMVFFIFYNIKLTYMYPGCWAGPQWNWEEYFKLINRLFVF